MLSRLNDNIPLPFAKVAFLFKPVALPVKQDIIVPPKEAEHMHWASVVFHLGRNCFERFEFDNKIKSYLTAYVAKNEDFHNINFLVSRNEENSLRVIPGNKTNNVVREQIPGLEEAKTINDELLSWYLQQGLYRVSC